MNLAPDADKSAVLESIESFITEQGFSIIAKDHARPWGGFFVLDESQAPQFIKTFFSHLSLEDFSGFEKLSPKIKL